MELRHEIVVTGIPSKLDIRLVFSFNIVIPSGMFVATSAVSDMSIYHRQVPAD